MGNSSISNRLFGERMRIAIENSEFTQKDLAAQLGCKPATVSQWVNHRSFPTADRLIDICGKLQVSSDWLLGLSHSYEHEINGIKWLEQIPEYIPLDQQHEIRLGIDLFGAIVEQVPGTGEWTAADGRFPNENRTTLTRAFKSAVRSGALRISGVQRDSDREKHLRRIFPSGRLRQVIVAQVPQTVTGRYLEFDLLRAEMVAFLAATEALHTSSLRAKNVGIGYGYTMLRFAEQSIPSQNHFSGTEWIAMAAFQDTQLENIGLSANSVASVLATRHPGSRAMMLPYIPVEERSVLDADPSVLNYYQTAAMNTLFELANASAIFTSVNGDERIAYDGSIRAERFQTVDQEFVFREALQTYRQLIRDGNKDEFGAMILGRMIDRTGQAIGPSDSAVFSINQNLLRIIAETSDVWIIAAGSYKARAVSAVLEARFGNALVIDSEIAEYLIREKESARGSRVESSYQVLFENVSKARYSVRATHRAIAPEEIHNWRDHPQAQKYYSINLELVDSGIFVQRVFILRRQAFFNAKTEEFEQATKTIIEQQQNDGIDVRIVWEEHVPDPGLLEDIVIIDTDLVYVNHPAGVVFHGWQAQALKTIEEIATYEDKFHTLIKEYSLSLDDAIEELHQAMVQSQHKES